MILKMPLPAVELEHKQKNLRENHEDTTRSFTSVCLTIFSSLLEEFFLHFYPCPFPSWSEVYL